MSGFFFDGDGRSVLTIEQPTEDSQTMPTDGYGIGNGAGKSIIETRVTERQISSRAQAKAVTAGLERKERLLKRRVQEEGTVAAAESLPAEKAAQKPRTAGSSDGGEAITPYEAHDADHSSRVRARLYCDCVWNIPGRLSSWSVSTMTVKTTSGGTVRRVLTQSAIG